MHDEIKKFSLSGDLAESNMVKTKERLVEFIESMMRDYGFVPSLDLEPQFTLDYSVDRELFEFTLSVYGVQIAKEEVWDISGVTNGKPVQRYTPQPK